MARGYDSPSDIKPSLEGSTGYDSDEFLLQDAEGDDETDIGRDLDEASRHRFYNQQDEGAVTNG